MKKRRKSTARRKRPLPRRIRWVFALLALLVGVFSYTATQQHGPVDLYSLRIAISADMHGDFESYFTSGSMSSYCAALAKLRAEPEPFLSIDCGDFSLGSAESAFTLSELPFRVMRAAQYDVIIPGNHEFDLGLDRFLANCSVLDSNQHLLCANLQIDSFPRLQKWALFTRGKLRIAVIGLMTPSFAREFPEPLRDKRLHFEPDFERALASVMPEVARANVDAVIVAMHSGRNGAYDLYELQRRYPQITLFLGGHSHQTDPGTRIGDAYFVQSAYRCGGLTQLTLTVDKNKGKAPRVVTESCNSDPKGEWHPFFRDELLSVHERLREKIGAPGVFAWQRAMSQTQMENTFITASNTLLRRAYHVPSVLLERPRYMTLQKQLARRDIFRMYGYNNMLCTMTLSYDDAEALLNRLMRYKRYVPIVDDALASLPHKINAKKSDKIELIRQGKTLTFLSTRYTLFNLRNINQAFAEGLPLEKIKLLPTDYIGSRLDALLRQHCAETAL